MPGQEVPLADIARGQRYRFQAQVQPGTYIYGHAEAVCPLLSVQQRGRGGLDALMTWGSRPRLSRVADQSVRRFFSIRQ